MAYLLNGQPLTVGRQFKDSEGRQYPANWLQLSTIADRARLGITEVADPERYDQRFYWGVGNPKALEDVNEVDENGDAVLDADGNQLVTKGLKSLWKAKQKEIAASMLAPTDWYVTRKAETDVAIPSEVSTYRAAVRTVCGTRESEISACTTTAELEALLTNSATVPNAEGVFVANTDPFITPWPEQA
jgi:hypothetical protein